MTKRRRSLSAEEQDLWWRVAQSATPLDPKRQKLKPSSLGAQTPKNPKPKQPDPISPFTLGSRSRPPASSVSLAPSIVDQLARQPVQMDHKVFGKLTRGKIAPEARIDLHGMTLDQAHRALNGFVLRAAGSGLRLLLVITGKGKTKDDSGVIPERAGALRQHVPGWLQSGALATLVMQVAPAHRKHGGGGAYYVYLRRAR